MLKILIEYFCEYICIIFYINNVIVNSITYTFFIKGYITNIKFGAVKFDLLLQI